MSSSLAVNLDALPFLSCPTGGVPVVGAACNAVAGGMGSAVSGATGSVLGMSVGAVFDAAGQWVASGATWLLGQVGHLMSSSTSVGLGTKWFDARESVMATLAAVVVLPMAFVGAIQAIYRQNAAVLTRAFLVHLPLAMLLTGVAVELVRLALVITDMLSQQVLSAGGVDTRHLLAPVAEFLGAGGLASAAPGFVVFVGALIVAVSALTLWLELVVRAAAVAAATLFLPLTLAALVWPAVSHWCRRLADTLAALVLSKFVVAAVLSLAVGALAGGLGTGGANGGGFAAVLTGIALLLIATLCPFTLLKLVPAVEAGAVAHLESVRHRLAGAAREPARARNFAMDVVALAGSGSAAGGVIAEGAEIAQAGESTRRVPGAVSSDTGDTGMNDGRPPPASVADWFSIADDERDQANRRGARPKGQASSASDRPSSERSSSVSTNRGDGEF